MVLRRNIFATTIEKKPEKVSPDFLEELRKLRGEQVRPPAVTERVTPSYYRPKAIKAETMPANRPSVTDFLSFYTIPTEKLQRTDKDILDEVKQHQTVSFIEDPHHWLYWHIQRPLELSANTFEKKRGVEQLLQAATLIPFFRPEAKPFKEMTVAEKALSIGQDVGEAILWTLPFRNEITRVAKAVAKRSGSEAIDTILGMGLDRWIATQGRLNPENRNLLANVIIRDRNWLVDKATQNMLNRMGRTPNVTQAAEQAVSDTIRDIETRLFPRATATGITRGGLPFSQQSWEAMTVPERVTLAQNAGLAGTVGSKAFANLTSAEVQALSKVTPVTPGVTRPYWQMTQREYIEANPQFGIKDWKAEFQWMKKEFPQVTIGGEIQKAALTENQRRLEGAIFAHRAEISDAILRDEFVPAEVLKDYPDLAKLKPAVTPAPPVTPEVTKELPIAMMEKLSVPEVARKATQQIEDKLQVAVNQGLDLATEKQVWVNSLIGQGVEERLAQSMVNIASENIKPKLPTPEMIVPEKVEIEKPVGVTPPTVPPVQPPITTQELPEAIPPSGKPRTLVDLNREAKGMRALTPEQRAAAMDIAKPIAEGELLYQVKSFSEHADNLLQPDSPIKQAMRSTPGWKQIAGLINRAQMERNDPVAMIGIQKAIFEEIETGRARVASLAWWNDAEELFGFKRVKGKWVATKAQPSASADTKKPYYRTIHDLVEHPENYNLTEEQSKILRIAQNMQNQLLRDAQRVGVKAIELTGDYWRRIVTKGPKDKSFGLASKRISGRKGYTMQRAFEFVDIGAKMGFEYETNPLITLQDRLESGIRTISDQEARLAIARLPGVEKPLERLESRYPQTIEGQKLARQARDEAKTVYLKNKTPENWLTLRQAEADYITAMREVFLKKIEVGQAGYYELRLPNGRIAPMELVEQIDKWIELPELRTRVGAFVNKVNEITQLLRTTLTNVDLAAGYIQGQILFYRNNPAWWISQSKALTSLIDDPTAYVKKNFAVMDEGVRMGAISTPTEFMFARRGLASIPTRVPGIGPVMRACNRAFEWFIVVGQTELYKSLRAGIIRKASGQITPAGVELEQKALKDLISLGSAIRKELGTESYAILGIKPNQRMAEQLTLFAARFFRANVGILGQTFTGGKGGSEARKAIGALIAGGLALTIGISYLTDKKAPNLTDPFAPDWLQFGIGKTYFNAFGPFYPYFRTIARASVYTSRGELDKASNEIKNFLAGKAGLLFRGIGIAGQFAFKGKARTFEGEVIPNTLAGWFKGMLGEMMVPISIQEAMEAIPQGRWESAIGEIFGLVGRGSPYNQMDILFQQATDINPEGISYRYAEPWQETEMEKRYPEIAKLLVGRGRGVWADASQMWAEVDDKYYTQEEALVGEFETKEITPEEFRNRYDEIQQARVNEKAGINKALDLFQDEKDLPDDPNDRALAEYYQVYDKATTASGRIDWDKVDQLMAVYEAYWTTEQKNFIERNTGLREHPPLIQEYIEAREKLRAYWEIPQKEREAYRQAHPDIDALLVKWYGYKPIEGIATKETVSPTINRRNIFE